MAHREAHSLQAPCSWVQFAGANSGIRPDVDRDPRFEIPGLVPNIPLF